MHDKPELIPAEDIKLVTNTTLAVTADGLMLRIRYVENVDRQKLTEPLNFLLQPHHATALGNELLRLARQASPAAKH